MKPRILFGSIFHETHTFLEGSISWSNFTVTRGEEILQKLGDGSPTDGFLQVAQDAGLEVVPLLDVRCLPCEIVEDQVFEQFWSEYAPRATEEIAKGIDAFYLVLHGGMCTETIRDPEGEFLARIRSLPGAADMPTCHCAPSNYRKDSSPIATTRTTIPVNPRCALLKSWLMRSLRNASPAPSAAKFLSCFHLRPLAPTTIP